MSYFFGINSNELKCKLTVPKFQNNSKPQHKYKLYAASINNHKWKIEKIECDEDKFFFYIDNRFFKNSPFFFLAQENEVIRYEENNNSELLSLNNFTVTTPMFRSNMRIYNSLGGFSSYQSEYPYNMIVRNGSILSQISSLTNKNADYNKVFLINIYKKPIKEIFKIFFIDIVKKEILFSKKIYSNTVNEIDIEKTIISPNVFLFTKNYIGIPVYVSSKENHLSCEHTHPPHEYIMSNDKMIKISELKKEVNEIIS